MKTKYINEQETQILKHELFLSASYVFEVINSKKSMRLSDTFLKVEKLDVLRIAKEMPKNPFKSLLLQVIWDCEMKSPGSGAIFLEMFTNNKVIDSDASFKFEKEDVFKYLKKVSDEKSAKIAMSAFELSGRTGKIYVDPHIIEKNTKIVSGLQVCGWKPPQLFWNLLGATHFQTKEKGIFVFIDGIIESFSEVHGIFQFSNEQKTPIAIFARGFCDDVINSCVQNINRKTAYVVPIEIPYDVFGANGLADVAMCVKQDIVSSLKGDLISTIKLEEYHKVCEVDVSIAGIKIKYDKQAYKSIVSSLSDRLKFLSGAEFDIMQKRIQKLGGAYTIIHIGKDLKSAGNIYADRIRNCIEIIISFFNFGLTYHNGNPFPYHAIKIANARYKSFEKMLNSVKVLLKKDFTVRQTQNKIEMRKLKCKKVKLVRS